MNNTKVTVGRDVHYFGEGNSPEEEFSGPYAAKVVAVDQVEEGQPQTVTLAVFFSGRATHEKTGVQQSDEPKKHHWSWPARV